MRCEIQWKLFQYFTVSNFSNWFYNLLLKVTRLQIWKSKFLLWKELLTVISFENCDKIFFYGFLSYVLCYIRKMAAFKIFKYEKAIWQAIV